MASLREHGKDVSVR